MTNKTQENTRNSPATVLPLLFSVKKKQWRPPRKKGKRRGKAHMPKPEEHDGMSQHQH
jgi:hypothetical protein